MSPWRTWSDNFSYKFFFFNIECLVAVAEFDRLYIWWISECRNIGLNEIILNRISTFYEGIVKAVSDTVYELLEKYWRRLMIVLLWVTTLASPDLLANKSQLRVIWSGRMKEGLYGE